MVKKTQIEIENKLISIVEHDEQDYICLTDMVRMKKEMTISATGCGIETPLNLLDYGKH